MYRIYLFNFYESLLRAKKCSTNTALKTGYNYYVN